jgi:hypothetical protein
MSNIKFILNNLKVYQLKDIIRQYLEKNINEKIIYKSKGKKDLLDIIKNNKINIELFEIPTKTIEKKQINILKKYQTQSYDEEDQKKFIEEDKNNKKFALIARKEYINKEGVSEKVSLQEHQVKFIKQFIYSNLQGSIAFHGVGSGKTLTAVVASYWYLQVYPDNKVIVISPSALLFNFIEGMRQYGLQIEDNRYIFTTYDKYVRKPTIAKNSLLIVDEAHNMRTEMKLYQVQDPETNESLGVEAMQNKRGFKIWKFGALEAHKILLLTGTAFVNRIYDIENLLSMIDQRDPLLIKTFASVLADSTTIETYFSHRISYYPSPKSEFFPERRETLVDVYMTNKMEEKYLEMKQKGKTGDSEKPNAFLGDEKYASNILKKEGINPKIDWCINKIKNSKQKFIVYTGLFDSGIKLLMKELNENNIKFVQITGRENALAKELSKKKFNGYDFNDDEFFKSNTNEEFRKYINSDYRVLLISRAGAEGVDTMNCQNLIILDHQWNDALSEQIIARAIRFKSHHSLPKKERFVNVYRLFLCFKNDKDLFNRINQNDVDFVKLNQELRDEVKRELKLKKIKNSEYLPTVKELKELKTNTGEIYIPEDTTYSKKRTGYNKKMQQVVDNEGWDYYKSLKTDEERKNWRVKMYARHYTIYVKKSKTEDKFDRSAIDLRLYVLCKSKQANIDSFIKYFGNNIQLFEQYESKLLQIVMEKEKELNKKLTDEEQAHIYATVLKDEKIKLKKKLYTAVGRTSQEKLQQYYTNDKLANELINGTNIKNETTTVHILEPTAGEGALIKPLVGLLKVDFNIDMVEIDDNNRVKLNELCNLAKYTLNLCKHKNFLTFYDTKRYHYIFMNPPFHLSKDSNGLLIHDVYDFDFVKRAYAFLKVGGVLRAITGLRWKTNKDIGEWFNSVNATIDEPIKHKFGDTTVTVNIITITKLTEINDNEIFSNKFYNIPFQTIGEEIMNGELSFKEIPKNIDKITSIINL